MFCKNCGEQYPTDQAVICVKCGTPKGQGTNFCPNCGKPVNPTSVVCMNCGIALQNASQISGQPKSKMAAGLLGIFLGGVRCTQLLSGIYHQGCDPVGRHYSRYSAQLPLCRYFRSVGHEHLGTGGRYHDPGRQDRQGWKGNAAAAVDAPGFRHTYPYGNKKLPCVPVQGSFLTTDNWQKRICFYSEGSGS